MRVLSHGAPELGAVTSVYRGNQGGEEPAQSPCGEQGDTGVSSDPQALPSLLVVQEPGRQLSSQRWGWGVLCQFGEVAQDGGQN